MRRIAGSLIVIGAVLGMTLWARDQPASKDKTTVGPAEHRLLAERQIILEVLKVAQAEANRIRGGFFLDKNLVREIVDFSRHYTGRCHFAKQQRYYFPAAQVYLGPPVYSLIQQLEAEQAYAVSVMEEIDLLLTGDSSDVGNLIAERLSAYVAVLQRQFQQTREQLYPKASTAFPVAEEQGLIVGFDRIEAELGAGFCDRYRRMAADLGDSLLLGL